MKRLIFLLFLCSFTLINAQEFRIITIQFDTVYGKKKWYNPKDNFYISEVIDNRQDKTNNIGIAKLGIANRYAQFKTGTIEENFNQFFKAIFPKQEGKIPVFAELNNFAFFEIHQFLTDFAISAELDINFYQKDENGRKILIGQFHEDLILTKNTRFEGEREKIFYLLIEKAISKIGTIHQPENEIFDIKSCLDTSYLPQKGIYLSYLDYIYNTPNEDLKYTVKIKGYDCRVNIKKIQDTRSFFGYCDGERFYYNENGFRDHNIFFCKLLTTVGRYILFRNGVGVENDLLKPSSLTFYKYYVLDLKMRSHFNINSPSFKQILLEHHINSAILEKNDLNLDDIYGIIDELNAKNSR